MSWTFYFHFFACFRSRNDFLQCDGERYEFHQHWKRSKQDTVWMKSKLLCEKSFIWITLHWNIKHFSAYNEFERIKKLLFSIRVDSQKQGLSRQLNYRARRFFLCCFEWSYSQPNLWEHKFFSTYSCTFFSAMLVHFASLPVPKKIAGRRHAPASSCLLRIVNSNSTGRRRGTRRWSNGAIVRKSSIRKLPTIAQ